MPRVHRVGDTDSDGDAAIGGSENVFANGGPTLGGAIATVLGIPDAVGIDDAAARAIIESRSAEIAAGRDPDLNEAIEQFNSGSPGGINPVDGTTDAIPAPGSDAAGTGSDDGTVPFTNDRPVSEWIVVQSHVDPRVLPEVWTKLENFAKSLGRPITLNSAYRSPEYNARIGGAKNSMHVQRKAIDVQWGTSNVQARVDMIQKAIDSGFTGIGCYNSFIHVDTGPKRHWGPTSGADSQYQQYRPVLRQNGYSV